MKIFQVFLDAHVSKNSRRFLRINIATYMLFSFTPFAQAQVTWSPVSSNQNFEVAINYDSLKRSSGIAKLRIKTADKADRSIMYEDLELDCELKRVRSVWAKRYDWRNKVRGISNTPSDWADVQPSTIMAVIYAHACEQ